MSVRLKLCLLLLVCGITAAGAREFWLAPRFFLTLGEQIQVPILVGNNFTGEQWRGKNSRLIHFVHYTPADSTNLLPLVTKHDPDLASVAFQQPGTHLISLATNNAFLTLPADSFNLYLKEQDLGNILLIRKERGEIDKPVKEAYRRCAKTLVQVGLASTTGSAFNHIVGLPLEVVPEQNPYTLAVGASLTLLVLADGKPVMGTLVQVWHRDVKKNVEIIRLHTNQNGRVLFRLSTPGSYLISTMRMSSSADHLMADWQSTWSSLTFGFAGRAPH